MLMVYQHSGQAGKEKKKIVILRKKDNQKYCLRQKMAIPIAEKIIDTAMIPRKA